MPAQELRKALEHLYHWQYSKPATNFTSLLYCLIQKSDPSNKTALAKGFPYEVQAFDMWVSSPDQDEFFIEQGIKARESINEAREG